MRSKNLMMIIAFVALAALVGLTVRSVMDGETVALPEEPVRVQTKKEAPKVWVAKETLDVGTFVDPEDLQAIEWPEQSRQPTYLMTPQVRAEQLVGSVVRDRLIKGDPLTHEKIVKPGERGFLSAVLLPGMRAITIGVDTVSGNAGLVLPGDRVDLILTQVIDNTDSDERVTAGETIATATRVLAVGTRLSTTANPDDVDERVRSVTLEATPRQVEAIAVADAVGSIKLSLRSLPGTESDAAEDQLASEAADLSKPDGPTFDYEVSKALEKGNRDTVHIMRGGAYRKQSR